MKKVVSIFFIVGLISINGLFAQNQKGNKGQKERMEEVNSKTKAELNLSESQVKEWDEIQTDYFKSLKDLKGNEDISKEDKKAKMQSLRKGKEEKITRLLSDEQMDKLIVLRKEMREEYKGKKKGRSQHGEKGSQMLQLKDDLNLSDAQLEKWDSIVMENRTKMQEINKDESLSDEGKKEKMRVMREEIQTEIMAILSSEQQAIYTTGVDDLQKRRKSQQNKNIGQPN